MPPLWPTLALVPSSHSICLFCQQHYCLQWVIGNAEVVFFSFLQPEWLLPIWVTSAQQDLRQQNAVLQHSTTTIRSHYAKGTPNKVLGSALVIPSVTRWLAYYSKFGHLHQWKLAQWHTKFAKVGPRFFQIVNKPSKNCPRLWRFWQNGKISPNLVTLAHLTPLSTSIFAENGVRNNCEASEAILLGKETSNEMFLVGSWRENILLTQTIKRNWKIPRLLSAGVRTLCFR